ncbi:hypothetical protein BZG36_00363 [Bifiguratus adelaidae]|uniref:Uncharacterized protein n=1 Tax=Bifiguratus adelaidae TaxID=1938954 RepID=A0A261Y7W2_9FUNG|nr:hypothetical protein BZG36_00363 [Bifiguratus adelaidae]
MQTVNYLAGFVEGFYSRLFHLKHQCWLQVLQVSNSHLGVTQYFQVEAANPGIYSYTSSDLRFKLRLEFVTKFLQGRDAIGQRRCLEMRSPPSLGFLGAQILQVKR